MEWKDLLSYDVFLCDMDGVLYRGSSVIPENVDVLLHLQRLGKRIRFLTNNSTRTPSQYRERLAGMGFDVGEGDVITSGVATARFLKGEGIRRVYVVGSPALREVIRAEGVKVTHRTPEAVVVGMDPNFNYVKLKRAASHVYTGALFIGTNPDTSLPVEDGVLPGAGAMLSAISSASGRDPDLVIGKPNPRIFEMATYDLRGSKVLVIGDRLNTDVLGGRRAGFDTLLVLTGVHTLVDVERLSLKPTYWVENLKAVWQGPSTLRL